MHGRPVTKKEIKQFKELYGKGESTRSIAKKLNRYHSTILYYFDKLNIKRRSRREAAKLGVKTVRIKIFKHKIPNSSKNLSLEKAYILGVLYGDGFLSYNNKINSFHIGLAAIDKEFVEKFKNNLFKVYKIKPTDRLRIPKIKNWNKQFITRLHSKEACNNILKYDSFKMATWKVPNIIKKLPLKLQAEFIKGFFDSEGTVDKRRVSAFSTNKEGIKDIQILLKNTNIRSTIQASERKKPRNILYRLSIQDRKSVEIFNKHINFTIIRKKEKLNQIINNYKLWTTPHEEVKKLKQKMIDLRNKGLSYEKIGKELNIGMVTVWNNIKNIKD